IQYQALLVLAEKDTGGGFEGQLDVFAKQGREAALAKAKSLGAIALESVPAAVASGNVTWGTFAIEVGKRVLNAEGTKVWKDDISPPRRQNLRVTKQNFTWPNGRTVSPPITVVFDGNQGKYRVVYSWKLV